MMAVQCITQSSVLCYMDQIPVDISVTNTSSQTFMLFTGATFIRESFLGNLSVNES